MPHYKCVTCRTRLRARQTPTASVGDLCPLCGSLLEPVEDLTEVIGFREITSVDGAATALGVSSHERIAQRIGDLVTYRDQRLARELRSDDSAGSRDDDPAAAAMALPLPCPDR